MLYVLSHLAAAAAALLLFFATGQVLVAAFLYRTDLEGLAWPVRMLLGVALWVAILFALASAGQLGYRGLLGVSIALVLAVACWPRLRSRLQRSREKRQAAPCRRRLWLVHGVATLAVGALLVPLLLLAIGPTVSWDADVYHLTLPRIYVEAGGFETVPVLVYQHWPHATELLFALVMFAMDHVVAKLLHFGFGVLVLLVLAQAVSERRLAVGQPPQEASLGAILGWLAAALVLANDVVFFELRVAYVELTHAFAFLVAVLLADRAADRKAEPRLLALAGTACGLMAGIKITGILWIVPVMLILAPAVVRPMRSSDAPLRRLAGAGAAFGLPVALLWLPWPVKAWWATGNPVYPFMWQTFGGPWWSSDLAARFTAWQQGIGMGRGLGDYLLLPWRVITAGGPGYDHFDGRLTPLWLVAVPLALLGARRDALARRAMLAAAAAFALWAMSSQQMRFLIPVLPLVALAAVIGLGWVLGRFVRAPLRPAVAAALVVSVLLVTATAQARTLRAGYGRVALYRQTSPEALFARAAPPVFAAIDLLPSEAHLLMIDTNRGFFCHRRYLADSFFEASQLAAWLGRAATREALAEQLEAAGITHVLQATRPSGVRWPPALGALLAASTLVHADAQHRLLALPSPTLPSPTLPSPTLPSPTLPPRSLADV